MWVTRVRMRKTAGMEINSLFGIPAHPLIVHAAVVLVPLVAIGTIVMAFWDRARGVFGWAVAGLSIAAFGSVGLAQKSGETLADHVEPTALVRAHTEMGEAILPWAFAIGAVACSVMALHWYITRATKDGSPSPSWFRPASMVLAVLSILFAVGGVIVTYQVGHSGAKATWEKVDMNGPSTGGRPAG
jgi:uncharacterized membrane protein YhdT